MSAIKRSPLQLYVQNILLGLLYKEIGEARARTHPHIFKDTAKTWNGDWLIKCVLWQMYKNLINKGTCMSSLLKLRGVRTGLSNGSAVHTRALRRGKIYIHRLCWRENIKYFLRGWRMLRHLNAFCLCSEGRGMLVSVVDKQGHEEGT